MNKYHKNLSESEIKEILKTLRNADITVGLNIIIGFPTETIDEARQTVDFVTKIRDLYRNCGIQAFSLEENTEVFNNPSKFGITKVYQEDKTSGRRLGYRYEVAHGMSMQEAEKFVDEAIKILHR
jgi:tRNA A37 methylthiotransferase MiaB